MSKEEKMSLSEYLKKEHDSIFEGFKLSWELSNALSAAIKNHEKRIQELEVLIESIKSNKP